MSQLQEHYRLLDIPLDASPTHLKQAYKDLVFVWHPDRFAGNLRLQKKAEEKLKRINLAYQQIREEHRSRATASKPSPKSPENPEPRASQRQQQRKTYQRSHQGTSKHVDMTLEQVRFIVSHFQFRATRRGTPDHKIFKSGPFLMEIHLSQQWVKLENLCDSLNGFHPILLAIPCKASATFFGHEGKEIINLFKQRQTQQSES